MAISFTIKNSEFRHKVLIQELKEISKDEDNLPIEEWITIRTAFAKITHQSGNESTISDGDSAKMTTKFFIRYSKIDLTPTTHRLVYNNKIYDIKYVSNVQEANTYLQILAEVRE